MPGFDYSQNGYYFITICIKNRIHWFGSIQKNNVNYSPLGLFAINTFQNIPKFYLNVSTDKFVIMPNHIHGIIIIKNCVGTEHCSVPTNIINKQKIHTYGLLSKIIKSYKNSITTYARNALHFNSFQWQRSYYDHIVRSEESLHQIQYYIQNNPLHWDTDEENLQYVA